MSEAGMYPIFPKHGIARPGDFLYLVPEMGSSQKPKFVQLGDMEPLIGYIFGQTAVENESFGIVTTGQDKDRVEILDLQPNKEHLYQFRFGVYGAAHLYLNIPITREVGGLDNKPALGSSYRDIGYYDFVNAPVHKLSPLTERWYNYDYYPAFKLYNPSDNSTRPEIYVKGAMFRFKDVRDQTILSMLNSGKLGYRYVNFSGIEHRKPV